MIDVNKFILMPLDSVEAELRTLGYEITIINNNYNVVGDTKLVTNVVISGTDARIYYGEFIFDVEGKNNDK